MALVGGGMNPLTASKTRFSRSLFRIVVAAAVVNGAAFGGFTLYRTIKRARSIDYKVPIKAIVQTGPLKEALKTAYLAELLGLSVDQPTLTSEFDIKQGEAKLLASPVIKQAEIQIREPGILYIDYITRQPVALLADYENIALDAEGYPFPVAPFFSPKNLPEIYLQLDEEIRFNRPLQGEKKKLAYELLDLVAGPIVCDLFNVTRIDVSNAFEKSYGRREIVLKAEDSVFSSQLEREVRFVFPRLLRLSTKKYSQDLANYLKLREQILEKEKRKLLFPEEGVSLVGFKEKIIDFRISQLAFIDEGDTD